MDCCEMLKLLEQKYLHKHFNDFLYSGGAYVLKKSGFYIVHSNKTEDEQGDGHWTCFVVVNGDKIVYFDSYGLPPIYNLTIFKGYHVEYYTDLVQHPLSSTCGKFCVRFLQHYYSSAPYPFSSNPVRNERLLEEPL